VNEQQPGDLAAVFERLQSLLLTASEVEGFLQRLTELAAEAVAVQPTKAARRGHRSDRRVTGQPPLSGRRCDRA
jgi:hypothetical protein